jgi:hypothetical protein
MYGYKEHTMLKMKQVSILDASDLIGRARFAVKLSPSDVARKYGLEPEHSFDDLGYFDFLCLQSGDLRVAFFQHTAHRLKNSYVSIVGADDEHVEEKLAQVLDIEGCEIHGLEGEW